MQSEASKWNFCAPRKNYARADCKPSQTETQRSGFRLKACQKHFFDTLENPRCFRSAGFVLALPIFPVSHPTSIFGENELNFCVRYGNRWTLIPISTNYSICCALKTGHHETAFLRDTSEPAYYCRSSPRLISISQLNTLLCLHP